MSRIIFACASLFLLSLCGQEVHAVFNITRIALDFSTSIREQIEKNDVYQSEKEVTNQLTLISTMLKKFYNESDIFKATVDFDFNVCHWPGNRSMSICSNLQDYLWFNDYLSNVTFNDLYHPFHLFIMENDYNLLVPKTYNESLNEYHTIIFTPDLDAGKSIVDLIIRNQIRRVKQSKDEIIYNLIKMIASMDARGFAMVQFSYALYKVQLDAASVISKDVLRKIQMDTLLWNEKNITSKMLKAEREFTLRNVQLYRKLKSLVPSLDKHVDDCMPKDLPASVPIPGPEKLPAIFQKYIINEGDMDDQNSCAQVCPDFREAKARRCYDKGSICNWQANCTGTLWDCESLGSPMQICLLPLNSSKKYEFFEIDGNFYGKKPKELSNCEGLIMKAESWTRGFFECTYCMCTCENNYIDQGRYFSLRPALSDINSNHIVTAVKWLKKNGIWHIQIQQGKFLSYGVVSMNLEWKDVDNFSINDPDVAVGTDYYAVSWYKRTVLLDSFYAPKNYVLTGLQFVSTDNHLKLKIRVTRFDFATGELFPEQTQWLLHPSWLQDRIELDLEKLQDYLDCKLIKDNTYFRFTTSSLEIDAGQSIVPALSSEIVTTNPPVPLSGAGIHLKNPAGDVQLDFKLETYDFARYF